MPARNRCGWRAQGRPFSDLEFRKLYTRDGDEKPAQMGDGSVAFRGTDAILSNRNAGPCSALQMWANFLNWLG